MLNKLLLSRKWISVITLHSEIFKVKVFLLSAIFWILFLNFIHANEYYFGSGTIWGQVYDEDQNPIAGATVILHELNTSTSTDSEGQFEFRNLRDGYYTLLAKSLGYASGAGFIELKDGKAHIVFTLKHTHIELKEVVVNESATGMVQPQQSLNITTANKDFISQSSGITLIQALQRIPGINSMDIGTGVSKPVIRGMGFNRLVVAQHNIKQQGQQWGADHGLEIDMYGIERVEVVKGPSSLLFGSDAIGGALNIRPSVIPQENTTQIELQTVGRSNNDLLGGSAMVAVNNNGKFLRFRASYQDYGDYRVPAEEFVYNTWVMPIPGKRLKNTSGNDLSFSMVSGIRKSWGISTLSVSNFNQSTGFFPASHGIPNPGSLTDPGHPRKTDYPLQQVNHFNVVSNSNFLLGNNRFEADLGFQQNHRKELNPPHVHGSGPLPDGNTELELLLNTFTANARFHNRRSESNTILIGSTASLQQNKKGGYNFLLPDYGSFEFGLFAISRWNINDVFYWNAGIRGDLAGIRIQQYLEPVWLNQTTIDSYRERTPQLDRNFFNIAFSGGMSWMINSDLNLKANLGRSFRNPSAIELGANGLHHGSFRHEMGDTSLTAERAWQLDGGLTFSRKELYMHFSPFLNYFPNFLFLNPSGIFSELPGAGQIYRFQQAEAIHFGGEFYTDWHISHALHTSIGAEAVWGQNLENNFPLPFTPPPALLGEISYNWSDLARDLESVKVLVSFRNVASQNRVARNEPATSGYTLVNTGIMSLIKFGNTTLHVSFMVNNLFDKLYKNHLSFYRILELPEPGRNFALSIKANLLK
jgi:iron complex outermembrane recepter protein